MKLWILLGNATTQMTSFIPSFFWPLLRCAANSCFARTNLIKLTIFEMGVEEMTPIRNREGPSLYYVSKKSGWVYSEEVDFYRCSVQVNLCQKLLFLHQLTHNMTTDCSLNYKFNTWKFQTQNMGRTYSVQKLFLIFRTIYVHNMFSPCSAKKSVCQRFTCTMEIPIF